MSNPVLAYLDPASGISGDMFLGCLLSVGWPVEALRQAITDLAWEQPFDHHAWSVTHRNVMKGPFHAMLAEVTVTEEGQPHRHLSDIQELLEKSRLPSVVITDAVAVFSLLAEAESAAHGIPVEQVHFHEVGALDSIIDIVGVCAGMHTLGLTLHAAPLPMAHGYTRTEHGMIPLPAPATLELLARANAPVKAAPGPGELVTPSGAALVLYFTDGRWHQPEMRLRKVGIGAGTLEFPWPNIARLWVGEPFSTRRESFRAAVSPPAQKTTENLPEPASSLPSAASTMPQPAAGHAHGPRMSLLETNIDDMNPEFYDAISDRLFVAGARDVWYSSIFMKKNRPGIQLSVLVRVEDEARIAGILLRESTTLGMRVLSVERYEAERRMETVSTPFGEIPVKLKIVDGEIVAAVPEYEPCKSAAGEFGRSVREVYEAAAAIAWQTFIAQ